jgi:hypothetical protein
MNEVAELAHERHGTKTVAGVEVENHAFSAPASDGGEL